MVAKTDFSVSFRISRRVLAVSLMLCGTSMAAGSAHAGFEWVPANKPVAQQQRAAAPAVVPGANPAPQVEAAPLSAEEEAVMPLPPLPGLEAQPSAPMAQQHHNAQPPVMAAAPQAQPQTQPVQQMKMATPTPIQGSSSAQPVAVPPPMPAEAMTQSAAPQPVIQQKTLHSSAEEKPAAETLPPLNVPDPKTSVSQQQQAAVQAPVPVQHKTRVVMPENAPTTALDKINRTSGSDVEVDLSAQEQTPSLAISAQPDLNRAAPVRPAQEKIQEMAGLEYKAPAAPLTDEKIIEGFGSDIPLALAIQQVLPEGYSYSFAKDVDVGAKVAWSGGKGWSKVLTDMIAPLGLQADIRGQHVYISGFRKQTSLAPLPPMEQAAKSVETQNAAVENLNQIEAAAGYEGRSMVKDPGEKGNFQPASTMEALEKTEMDKEADAPASVLVPPAASEASPMKSSMQVQQEEGVLEDDNALWEARKGDSLKETIVSWAKTSGYRVEWEAGHDYRLNSNIAATGKFEDALKALVLTTLDGAAPAMFVARNQDGTAPAIVIRDPQVAQVAQ